MKRLGAALTFLILAGCATSKPPDLVYLGDLDLQPVPGSRSMRAWSSRPGVLGEYHAFLLEPVIVSLGKADTPDKEASPDEMKSLGEHLLLAFATELKNGGYSVVDAPGKGVLRVRAALTELVPVDPAKNAAAKVVGSVVAVGIFIPTVDIGHAAIEVEMRDSMSDARVAAFSDRKAGRGYFNGLRPYRRWGDVESAFSDWAREFRARLDQIHGTNQSAGTK
jgi:hypothetical protein